MVDDAVRAAKIAAIRDAVDRIRQVLPASLGEFEADRTKREVVILNLFVAIQESVALATHWIADAGRAVPATYGEAFLALAQDGVVSQDLARRLASAAAFRNLIAHQYGVVDSARVFGIASERLGDIVEFCRAIATPR